MDTTAREILQKHIGKKVVFSLDGKITSIDLTADDLLAAMKEIAELSFEAGRDFGEAWHDLAQYQLISVQAKAEHLSQLFPDKETV